MFLVTLASVFGVHWVRWSEEGSGWMAPALFSVSLMAILAAHELGHFGVAKRCGFRLSLPMFIPMPLIVGTLGAIIRFRELPKTREGLLAMGIAGPVAGAAAILSLLTARQLLGWGAVAPDGQGQLVPPLMFHAVSMMTDGTPALPVSWFDPIGFACWIGCLMTSMNLIPVGQLDGGHLVCAKWPERAREVGWVAVTGMVVLGYWWPGWWVWCLAALVVGGRPVKLLASEPATSWAPLVIGCCLFLLCFTPVPFSS